jgi:hypothetical protein
VIWIDIITYGWPCAIAGCAIGWFIGSGGKDKVRAERIERMYSGARVNEAMERWRRAPKD